MSPPKLSELLQQFSEKQRPGVLNIVDTHFHPGTATRTKSIVFGVAVHGNEFGSLPAALQLMAELDSGELSSHCDIYIIFGNRKGAENNQRFIEEDLNRVFTFDRPAVSHERRRAQALRPLLDQADVFLDIHQTQTPTTSAFYTFPWSQERGDYARALGAAPVGLTRKAGERFSSGMCCADEYVRDRRKVAFTLEIGFRGLDTAQAERAYCAMRRLIDIENRIAQGETLQNLANESPQVHYSGTAHVEKNAGPDTFLRPGLSNFSPVKAGERLSPRAGELFSWSGFSPRKYVGKKLLAPSTGVLLFPKYPTDGTAMPGEIYRLAKPIEQPELL